jgi:3-phosphoshikimate 1-carboxyvinyltransferase
MMTDYRVEGGGSLAGVLTPPGDKSVSHRILILNALSEGTAEVRGFNPGDDVARTRRLLEELGTELRDQGEAVVRIHGTGGRFRSPSAPCDCGNSGTTARLLAGVLAGQDFPVVLTGDASLGRRPMERIALPLRRMGARAETAAGGTLPLRIRGGGLRAIRFANEHRSAQVKGCVLLAGLFARGTTRVFEEVPTRDHTERLLEAMGVEIERRRSPGGTLEVAVPGGSRPEPLDLAVPGDPSAAAPFIVAALVTPGSELACEGVLLNPGRIAFLRVLERMGAAVEVEAGAPAGGEPTGILRVRSSELSATAVSRDEMPGVIDEFPVLCVAAACARGDTAFDGVEELRVKESDRVRAMASLLDAAGISCLDSGGSFRVAGGSPHGGRFASGGDHRVAMAAAALALAARGESRLQGGDCVRISHPSFFDHLREIYDRPIEPEAAS